MEYQVSPSKLSKDAATELLQAESELSEQNIKQLEEHWSELQTEAVAEATGSGWKISILRDGIFSRIGFRKETFISFKRLLAYARGDARRSLVERWLAVFEHIRKLQPSKPASNR
jgi:hypothetical protein